MLLKRKEQAIKALTEENRKLKAHIKLNSTYPQKAKEMISSLEDKQKKLDKALIDVQNCRKEYLRVTAEAKKIMQHYKQLYEKYK